MRVVSLALVWIASHLYHDYHKDPVRQQELNRLRQELALTREALDRVEEGSAECGWKTWVLSWLLKGALWGDLVLLVYFLAYRVWPRRTSVELGSLGDTGGSSDSEDQTPVSRTKAITDSSATGGTEAVVSPKSRPTRPSDLRRNLRTWWVMWRLTLPKFRFWSTTR